MATLRVLSGGAAQAVVEKIAAEFQRATGHGVSVGTLEMGITQVTEILPNNGVKLASPLPDELQMKRSEERRVGKECRL